MGRRTSNKRTMGSKPERNVILGYCEGSKTEKQYFTSLKRICGDHIRGKYFISIKRPGDNDPIGIVKAAIAGKKKNKLYKADSVWCVFDVDTISKTAIREACEMATTHKIRVLLSNPSFELWYLLHYQDQNAHIGRNNAIVKLRDRISTYEKSDDTLETLAHIPNSLADATCRAKSLNSNHTKKGTALLSRASNPSTQVFEFFEFLGISNY